MRLRLAQPEAGHPSKRMQPVTLFPCRSPLCGGNPPKIPAAILRLGDFVSLRYCNVVLLTLFVFLMSGCGVVSLAGSVAGAAVDVTGAVISTGVKVTGAVVSSGIEAASK